MKLSLLVTVCVLCLIQRAEVCVSVFNEALSLKSSTYELRGQTSDEHHTSLRSHLNLLMFPCSKFTGLKARAKFHARWVQPLLAASLLTEWIACRCSFHLFIIWIYISKQIMQDKKKITPISKHLSSPSRDAKFVI